jgi:hypothetical protein
MSSNGPPPSELERIKTKLTNAGLSVEQITLVIKAAQESAHVLGVSIERLSDMLAESCKYPALRPSMIVLDEPTSPPPPIKKQYTDENIAASAAAFRKKLMNQIRTRPDPINQSVMDLEMLGKPFGLTDMLDWDSNTDDLDLDIF